MGSRPSVTATERYRHAPEPWYWVAAALVPLAVTLGVWQSKPLLTSRIPSAADVARPAAAPAAGERGNPVDVRSEAAQIFVSAVVGDTGVRDRLLDTVHTAVPDRGVVDETAVDPGERLTNVDGLPAFLSDARRRFDRFDVRLTDDEVVVRGTTKAAVAPVVDAAKKAFPGRTVRTDIAPDQADTAFACDRLEEQIGARLRRDPVNFESESARVDAPSTTRVRAIGVALADCGSTGIRVNGHADATGPQALNVDLARSRAEAVRDILVEAGVDEQAVTAEGFGAWRNIAPNDTPAQRAENRRVVILVENGGRS